MLKKTIEEFKKFIARGNVIDLAIAVIIGSAFGKIVTSLIGDIIMPLLGALLGGINFKALSWVIKKSSATAVAITVNYGVFIQAVVDFLLIAWIIFIAIKVVNKLRTKEEEEKVVAPSLSRTEELLQEIRDLLKK